MYETFEHTADLGLRVRAPDLGQLFTEAAQALLQWLDDDKAYAQICRELLALREQTARPGACARAARRIVEVVEGTVSWLYVLSPQVTTVPSDSRAMLCS